MNPLMILIAIFAFGLLIFVHELGHFLAAKKGGIQVNEFAMGMGPKLISFTRGETTYSLRAFPIGGFCAMEGEDEESDEYNPRAFGNVKLRNRFVAMAAGSVMNLLLGFILLTILTANMNLIATNQIARFHEDATSDAWLMEHDTITRINGSRVRSANDIRYEFTRSRDGVLDIEVIREGERVELTGVTFPMYEFEGVTVLVSDLIFFGVQPTPLNVVQNAFNWTASVVRMVWGSLVDLVTGRFGFNQISGPIGLTVTIGETVATGVERGGLREGALNLIFLVSVISINLGIFNLLPFPALDGGRIIFLLIEGVRRKPVPAKYESAVNTVGFALLIGLIIVVTFNDIFRRILGLGS
ncbi:MAG: site-2 protease family protein [Oscillospiraceae bacterium]|nr:site-2 protease family protein [Oscillospiraceae bacterium]